MRPSQLNKYQHDFAAYLQSGDSSFLSNIFPNADNIELASVYRNGFMRSCVNALCSNYPVIDRLVGHEYFGFLAQQYIHNNPPKTGSLVGYGEQFPEFISEMIEHHQLSYLASFALLDRAWLQVYLARDDLPINPEWLQCKLAQGIDIETLNIRCIWSSRLVILDYQALSLWSELKDEGNLQQDMDLIHEKESSAFIWRTTDDRIQVRSLNLAETTFFEAMAQHSTLNQSMQMAQAVDAQFDIAEFFSMLLNASILAETSETIGK